MKKFLKKLLNTCKKRPLALWILLFCWSIILVTLCVSLQRMFASPMSFSVLFLLTIPIGNLFLYIKPLIKYEVVQIVFSNLALATYLLLFIFSDVKWWIFGIIALIELLIAMLAFALEIRMLHKKQRNGTLKEYLDKLGVRTYIKRK